ncbi:MAG: hypothetical protein RJA70_3935 [Pseudomonadota bacterium]|jgi:hypothetical protein
MLGVLTQLGLERRAQAFDRLGDRCALQSQTARIESTISAL